MERAKILEEVRREVEYHAAHSQRQYFSRINDYLDFVGPTGTGKTGTLYNYTQKLKKEGLKQQTVNYIVRGPIGCIFRAYGLRMPIKLPKAKSTSSAVDIVNRIQFTVDEMKEIINAAKAGSAQEKAIMAVATVYGTRMGEILHIRPEDVHPKKQTIVIGTEKQGLPREHSVPIALHGAIFGYDWHPIVQSEMYRVFGSVLERTGIPSLSRKSFHAIRHGLITAMVSEWEIEWQEAYTFLRWKQPGMLATYAQLFHNPKNDAKVFLKHELLKEWAK